MDSKARRAALRDFLKEARARLLPEDVGLRSSGRRRVPGLRREEVAELSGISLAWYTLIETASEIRVSPRLLDRLATTLRLNESEKIQLFSLAIDEMPTLPRATPEFVGAIGREYFELARFARRSRTASSISDLADLVADLLFDLEGPVQDAYIVSSDLRARRFAFLTQRTASHFDPVAGPWEFSAVQDAELVLVEGGLSEVTGVGETPHMIFAPRARQLGGGRFMSKGVQASALEGAIGYFQATSDAFCERDRARLALVAEIMYLALAGHV